MDDIGTASEGCEVTTGSIMSGCSEVDERSGESKFLDGVSLGFVTVPGWHDERGVMVRGSWALPDDSQK